MIIELRCNSRIVNAEFLPIETWYHTPEVLSAKYLIISAREFIRDSEKDSVLNIFLRMASRRCIPEVMYSDNEGNFMRTDKELKKI